MRITTVIMAAVAAVSSLAPLRMSAKDDLQVRDSVLTVPAAVRKIAPYAFKDRTDIARVEFEAPSSLSEIGEYAFLGCANLREIRLPQSLMKFGEGAFRECSSLTCVDIPREVTVLPRYLFSWCEALTRVDMPRRLADIGSGCFAYCKSLSEISFPPALTHIGANAFSFCSSLEKVVLPNRIAELESYAFSECVSLREATLPANDRLLGELIFSGCRSLRTITELSAAPPKFDCNSTLFEENEKYMYDLCELRVPMQSQLRYRKAPAWRLFRNIEGVHRRGRD